MELKALEKFLRESIQSMSDKILKMDEDGEYDEEYESYLQGRIDSYILILDII